MHVVTIALQIDPSRQSGIIFIGNYLHLEGKCQVFIYVWILQIINISMRLGIGKPVKKHKLSRLLPVQIHYQLPALQYFIPVQIDHHFDCGILRQHLFNGRKGVGIGIISGFHVIHTHMVDYVIAVFLPQNLRQQLSRPHYRGGYIPRHGIHKILLGMGMVN